MSIWAEIKKSINSNLNKPLDVTLGEIQGAVNNSRVTYKKVQKVIGVPYNADHSNQVITNSDAPLLSVTGKGRILQILPLSSESNGGAKFGTALVTVDNKIVFNGRTIFATLSTENRGLYILTNTDNHKSLMIYCDMFSNSYTFYIDVNPYMRIDTDSYNAIQSTLIEPFGLPFNNGFEIRMTQAFETNETKYGFVVVYELYE